MFNLSRIYQKIHQWGRHCLHCGGYSTNDSLFCSVCIKTLWARHMSVRHGLVDEIPIFALFCWEQDRDRQTSMLVTALKGGVLPSSLEYYAQEFLFRERPHVPSNSIIVPCPGSRPDHASQLAKKFGDLISIETIDLLCKIKPDEGTQKSKSKEQRSQIKFHCKLPVTDRHVIFIDDVVTTGATVRAAKQAIGPCQSFQVWALAQRVVSLRAPC